MQSGSLDLRTSQPKPGDILAGKYRIEGTLGEGGMGTVYAARNLATGKRVALKWVLAERADDEEILTRFQREARAAGRIDHPNVVSVFDVGQHGPSTFLVMELLDGHPLSQLLESGPLPQDLAVHILMPALRGIAAAHAQGVIHRDLKPDNIFLCLAPDGAPRETKVLDFGVSKMTDEMSQGLSVTKTGAVVGTPYYMSPEQVRGVREIDARIDVYAMGVILFEMLARRPPFMADSYSALVVEIATGDLPNLRKLRPDVDEGLVKVVEKAMQRDRKKRYQDIESFARALEPFGDGIKFKPDRPDWTARISTKSGTSQPWHSDGFTDPDADLRQSGIETVTSSVTDGEPLEEAQTAAALPITVDTGDDHGATVSATPQDEHQEEEEQDTLEDEPVATVPARRGKAALWIGAAVGMVALVVGLVLALGEGDEPVPGVASEPGSADAPQVGSDGTAEAVSDEGTGPTGPGTGQVAESTEGTAGADVEAVDEAAEEPAGTDEAVDEAAEEPAGTDEAALRRRRAAARARRRARAREAAAARTMDAPAMEPTPMPTMRTPRAGSLSLDDF